MNVVMVSPVRMNPYVNLLAQALEQVEADVTCSFEEALTPAVVAHWRGRADVLHMHWVELYYRSSSLTGSARKLATFLLALMQARRAGISLVYTAHNVHRHDDGTYLDLVADALLYRLVDAVHVHDAEAQAQLILHHRPRRIAVIAHGNYVGVYPDTCTREDARQRFGFALNDTVFLALGQIRPYKGLDDLIVAFRRLEGRNLRLLIAGHPHDKTYGESLAKQCKGDERIRLDLRYVPDDELQYYLRAADICVLPYRSATTSGAAILAFSFGVPIIAPDRGPFPLLVTDESGLLYSAQPGALQKALAVATRLDLKRAGAAALAVAATLDWQTIARRHLDVYKGLIRQR